MEGIPLEIIAREWGPTGLLALFILGIFTGLLVPVRFYREMKDQRDTWMASAQELTKQNTKLLESSHVADATFKALKNVATKETEVS